jgi:hypothetical protein
MHVEIEVVVEGVVVVDAVEVVVPVVGDVVVVGAGVLGVEVHQLVIVDDVEGVLPVDDEQRAVCFLSIFSVFHGGSDSRRG